MILTGIVQQYQVTDKSQTVLIIWGIKAKTHWALRRKLSPK